MVLEVRIEEEEAVGVLALGKGGHRRAVSCRRSRSAVRVAS